MLRPRQADVKSALISPRPQALTEGLFAQVSCGVIPSQCSHWRGNPFPAPTGAASPLSAREVSALRADGGTVIHGRGRAVRPYTRSDVPCERPLPLPLGEVAERSEDGEGKP